MWLHAQSQGGISRVQQELPPSVGAHHCHRLLVQTHLKTRQDTAAGSGTKLKSLLNQLSRMMRANI